MNIEISKELIFDNFANKTTPLQRKQIDTWLQSISNEEQYYKWLEDWENQNLEYSPDSEALIKRYTDFFSNNAGPLEVEQPKHKWRFKLQTKHVVRWSAAASIFFLLGIAFWQYQDNIYYKSYQTTFGEVKSFILRDGTQITLNANSQLSVPRFGFGESTRRVSLNGEAAFSVTHTPSNQKFIVKTNKGFEVVVLGTEFSVFSRSRGANVVLKKGKVLVNYNEGKTHKQIVMKPGELVSFNKQNQALVKKVTQTNHLSLWKEKRFVFEETMLSDVAQMLEETYGLKVTIESPELAHRKLMGSFRAENVDELLVTISELLDLNVVRQEDKVHLSEK